jgi:VanZ family protein
MEFVQKYFVSNRSFDIGDILADGVGSFLGSAFSIRKYIKK